VPDNLDFPPPNGPKFGDSPSEPVAPSGSIEEAPIAPPADGDGLWTAPSASTVKERVASRTARATTAESLELAIPEITGSVPLDVPEAAVPVALTGLDRITAKVLVNGMRIKPTGMNTVSFPMIDGTRGKIRIGGFPGFPVVKFKGKVLYRHPKPAGWEFALLCLTLTAPFLGILLGVIGIAAGFGLLYAHISMIKRGVNVWVRSLVPFVVAAVWTTLIVLLVVWDS